MKKKLLSLTLAFFVITTSVVALADNDFVTVYNKGWYVLNVHYTDPSGGRHTKSLSLAQKTQFVAAHTSDIHLLAATGKSTHLMSKNGGFIKCNGTTLIGFECKYTN